MFSSSSQNPPVYSNSSALVPWHAPPVVPLPTLNVFGALVNPQLSLSAEKSKLNSLVTEVLTACFDASATLLVDPTDLMRWKFEFLSLHQITEVPSKMLNQRHVPFIMWTVANCSRVLATATNKLDHDTHIHYLLFMVQMCQSCAWLRDHAGYDHGFVLAEQHNALMHMLNGNGDIRPNRNVHLISAVSQAILDHMDDIDLFPLWRIINRMMYCATQDEVLEIVNHFASIKYGESGYCEWLQEHWSSLMHALNGNIHGDFNPISDSVHLASVCEGVNLMYRTWVLRWTDAACIGQLRYHAAFWHLDDQLWVVANLVFRRGLGDDYSGWLQANWNAIMHAVNGNGYWDKQGWVQRVQAHATVLAGLGPEVEASAVAALYMIELNVEYFNNTGLDEVEFPVWPQVLYSCYVLFARVTFVDSGWSQRCALMHNRLMHAYNGNPKWSRARSRNGSMHRAYAFDKSDPTTWKFDDDDAYHFVNGCRDHDVVRAIGIDRVVTLMSRRRGVKTAVAFSMTCEAFVRLHVGPGDRTVNLADLTAYTVSGVVKKSGITNFLKTSITAVTPDVTFKPSPEFIGKIDETNQTFLSGTGMMSEGLNSLSSAIGSLSKTAESISRDVSQSLPSMTTDYLVSLLGEYGKSPLVLKLVRVVRDIIVAWNVDSFGGTIALTTLLAETASTGYAVLVTACVAIMKQFTKWCDDTLYVKKGFSDFWSMPGELFSPLINLLTSAVFNVQKSIPMINGAFTFAKNMSTPVDYLCSALKQALNFIWEAATGHEFYVSEVDQIVRELTLLQNNIVAGVSGLVDHGVLGALKSNSQTLQRVCVRLQLSKAPAEVKTKWARVVKSLVDYIATCGVETEMVTVKPRTVVVAFYGKTGVGKTSVPALFSAAIGRALHWPGDSTHWHSQFSLSADGFQVPLPADCRSVQIDEPFSNKDSTVTAEEMKNFLLFVGINPFQMEGATLDHKNDFVRVDVTYMNYNLIPVELGTHNPEAGHRRVDLKFEIAPLIEDPFKHLGSMDIDRVFSFTSNRTVFSFTQVASMIIQKVLEYRAGSVNFELARSQLLANFEPVYVQPVQATSLFARDDSKLGNLERSVRFSPVQPEGHLRGPTPHSEASSSPSLSTKKGHITREIYDKMYSKLSFDDIAEMLSKFPDGEVTFDYVKRYLDSSVVRDPTKDEESVVAVALNSALGVDQKPPSRYYIAHDTGCVCVDKNGRCLVHPRPLHCMTLIRGKSVEYSEIQENTYWSLLLSQGKFIGDKIDAVLREYTGTGLKHTVFAVTIGVIGGTAIIALMRSIGYIFGVVGNWLFPSLTAKKAYGNQYAVQAHNVVPVPRFVPAHMLHADNVSQKANVVYSKHGRPESIYQTLNKIHVTYCTLFEFEDRRAVVRAQFQAIAGRLGWTVKHGFLEDGKRPKLMVLPPPYSKVLVVKPVDGYSENDDFFVQTEFDHNRDVTFVILPIGLNLFPDVSDRFIRGDAFNVSLFNQAMLYYKPTLNMEVSDDLKSVKCEVTKLPLLSLPAGRFVGIATCDFTDGSSTLGMQFVGGPEPPDGSCGGAVCPLDTHFGENYLGVAVVGYSKAKQATFATFLCLEDIQEFYTRHPKVNRGVKISDHTGIEHGVVTADFSKKCSIAHAARPGFLPSSAGLYRSPVFGCLTGVEIKVDGETVLVPPPVRVPSPVRDAQAGFSKYPPYLPPLDPGILQDVKLCAVDTANYLLEAGKDYPYKRGDYLSVDEVLNGTVDGQVIGMNMDSSAGYTPEFKGKQGNKHDFCDRIDDRWSIKPEFAEEAEDVFQALLICIVMYYVAKTTPKGELRMPEKVTRLTSSKPFFVNMALRRVFAPMQAFIAYGAPRNGTARAVDPTGPSGEQLQVLFNTFLKKLDGDAKKFDASQRADVSNVIFPIISVPLLRFVYPTKPVVELTSIAEAAAIINHLAYELFGSEYFLHIDGNISGCLLTTDVNDFLSAVCLRMSWLIFYRSQTKLTGGMWVEFRKHVRYATQGDDIGACTNCDFNLFHMEKGYAALGIQLTSADKDSVDRPYSDHIAFLKRIQAKLNGKLVGRLPLSVIHEIISYIRVKVQGREDATLENVRSAFTELLVYGRSAYETCRAVVNQDLARAGCPLFHHTYDDLLSSWSEKWTTSLSFVGSSPSKMSQTMINLADVNPVAFSVEKKSRAIYWMCKSVQPRTLVQPLSHSSALLSRGFKKRVANSNAGLDSTSKVEADGSDRSVVTAPLKEAKGLTQFNDSLRKVGTVNINAASKILSMQDPYPDQDVKTVLEREYQLGVFTWASSDLPTANTPIFTVGLPEALYAIPKLFNTLSAFRFLQAAVRISLRINATLFTQGRLLIRYVPACPGGSWRSQFYTAMQAEHVLLSPSSAETCEITIPWVAPKAFTDMENAGDSNLNGVLEVYVLHPAASASAVALPDMTVNVFASFVNPIVTGMGLGLGPTLAVKKSALEAIEKVAKGVLVGVNTGKQIVSGGMKMVNTLEEIGGLLAFDKPFTVAATQPVVPRMGGDMPNTKGLVNGIVLGCHPDAIVATEKALIGSNDPHGSLSLLMRRPGILYTGVISVTPTSPDQVYFDFPVKPSFSWNFDAGFYSVTPLAYYSQFFKYWRGTLKYKIVFSASKLSNVRVRISYVPNAATTGAIPENQAGDVTSAVLVVNGDTDFEFSIPYLAETLYKGVDTFTNTDTDGSAATGRVIMQLISPIAAAPGNTAVGIYFTVYVAAGEDFQVLQPDSWDDMAHPMFTVYTPPPAPSEIHPVTRHVTRKSFITTDFMKPFPGLVPTKSMGEDKLCSPEHVTSVVELMRRFENLGTSTLNATFPAHFDLFSTPNWHYALAAPFITWRGGLNLKLLRTVYPSATTTAGVTTFALPHSNKVYVNWALASGAAAWQDFNGQIITDIPFNPWTEVNIPFYDQVYCREVNPLLGQMPETPKIEIATNGDDGFDIYAAVGDDFSLGPFVGPPLVEIVAPDVVLQHRLPPFKPALTPVPGAGKEKGLRSVVAKR